MLPPNLPVDEEERIAALEAEYNRLTALEKKLRADLKKQTDLKLAAREKCMARGEMIDGLIASHFDPRSINRDKEGGKAGNKIRGKQAHLFSCSAFIRSSGGSLIDCLDVTKTAFRIAPG